MAILLFKLATPEYSGDWHDKPLRWKAVGPANEIQKFSTREGAAKYKKIRKRAESQSVAIRLFAGQID